MKIDASSGTCKALSTSTSAGCRSVGTSRTSSRGSSASHRPYPVSTAQARALQAWPSLRASADVIH